MFAHVTVIDANGTRADPNIVNLTTGVNQTDGGDNPVAMLATEYRSGTRFGGTEAKRESYGNAALAARALPVILLAGLIGGGVLGWRRRQAAH